MSDFNDIALASAQQAANQALAPLALELGITDLSGIKSMQDLFNAWKNNTRDVSLFALLDMSSQAYGMSLDGKWAEALAEFGSTKLKILLDELIKASKIFADEIAADPELAQSIANLDVVQNTIFPLVSVLTEIYQDVQQVLVKLEPFMPYIELLIRALGIWINPAEAQGFTQDSFKLAMKELSKVTRLLYADFKKWLIEDLPPIKVPEVLMGLADGVLDPSYSLDQLVDQQLTEAGVGEITDTNWFDVNDVDMQAVIQRLGEEAAGSIGLDASFQVLVGSYGVEAFSWFSNYYQNLLEYGNLETGHNRVEVPLTPINIQRFSQDILDLLDDLSKKSFSTTTMLKMGCDLLAKDGAIVDYATLSYNERATENGGISLRKRFYDINNTINNYHKLLSVLKGEIRFNLSEKIPVVDFFEDYFSLQSFYENEEHTEIAILDTEELDLDDLYNKDQRVYHQAIINAALKSGTAFEEIFYHPDYINLVVDSNGMQGPPFLAGKFATIAERDNNDKIVSWTPIDETAMAIADNPSSTISVGTYYNKVFLDDSGWYVERPLTAETPATYRGYATEVYTEANNALSTFKSNNDYTATVDWQDEELLKIADVSYNNQPGVHRLEVLGDLSTTLSEWNSHISGSTFTVTSSDTYSFKEIISYNRRNHNNHYTSRADAITDSILSTKLEGYKNGELNKFTAAIAMQYSGADHLYYLSIRSPYDILLEKYQSSSFVSAIQSHFNKDLMFLYSATEFQGAEIETSRTKVRTGSKLITRWFSKKVWGIKIWLWRWKRIAKYSWVTKLIHSGEVAAENPDLYLVSKHQLSNVEVGNSIFFYGSGGKVIGFKVSQIDEYAMPANIKVDMGNNIMDAFDATTRNGYIAGTACWAYRLENLAFNGTFNYDPFAYPYNHFVYTTSTGINTVRWSALQELTYFEGKRGLPLPADYSSTIRPHGKISAIALDKILGVSTVAAYIRNKIMSRPLIQVEEGGATVVSLEESIPIFKTLSEMGNVLKNLPVDGSEVLQKYMTKWANCAKTLEKVQQIYNFRLDDIEALDNLFGDTLVSVGGPEVPPWIEITDTGSDLYVPDDLFANIAKYLIEQLEGTGQGAYLQRVKDGPLTGRSSGLYYQRYLILNQRMNKSTGSLYLASTLQRSSNILDNNQIGIYDQLQILRYDLDALPVYNMQKLVFINNKFIDNAKYDIVRKGIGDKCLLTCGTCPVKYSCPFYNEHEVILTMLNQERTFSVYLKDNKLDLVSSIKIDGKELHSEYKKYHYPYSDINDGDVRLIGDVLEQIDEIDPSFLTGEVSREDMGWLNKARYGTVDIAGDSTRKYETLTACSVRSKDLYTSNNKYLYDALFFEDVETSFEYNSGKTFKVGNAQVTIREAHSISAFSDLDDIFLVSNDGYDPIYLGKLKDLELQIENPQSTKAYAQAYINLADYENPNQVWGPSYEYLGKNYPGRPRRQSSLELIGDGSYTKESILAGKPNIRRFTEFLREVKIPIANIKWALSGKAEDIIAAKKSLPFFETDVRIVNVQR